MAQLACDPAQCTLDFGVLISNRFEEYPPISAGGPVYEKKERRKKRRPRCVYDEKLDGVCACGGVCGENARETRHTMGERPRAECVVRVSVCETGR